MAKPCRKDVRFESLEVLLADVNQLRTGPIEQCGQWSLAMMLDHLSRWTTCMLDGGLPRVPRFLQWIARAMIRRTVRKQAYPTFKLKAIAALKPAADIPIDTAYATFVEMVDRVRRLPGPVVRTLPFGDLPLRDFQQMMLLHAAHHLAFLKPSPAATS